MGHTLQAEGTVGMDQLGTLSHPSDLPLFLPLRAEVGGCDDDIILVLDQHGDLPAAR